MESGAVLAAASLCSHRAMDIKCCISYTPIRMVADAIIEYPSCLAFTRSFIHLFIHHLSAERNPMARKAARKPVKIAAADAAAAPKKTAAAQQAGATPSKPRLLSGGNPQIPKGDGDAPVQAYIAAMPGWKHEVGRYLDALIVRTVPHPSRVRKAVRWNTPFYGIEGRPEMGWFLAFHCLTKYIKVAFFQGSSLQPLPPVKSKVKNVRYFHIHESDWKNGLDEQLLSSWILQASKLPGDTCF